MASSLAFAADTQFRSKGVGADACSCNKGAPSNSLSITASVGFSFYGFTVCRSSF